MNAKNCLALASVAVCFSLILSWSVACAIEKPGVSEGKVFSLAPGQSLRLRVDLVRDPVGPDQMDRGIAVWKKREVIGWWGTFPRKEDRFDAHGGLVDPGVGGKGGTWVIKNDSSEDMEIFVHSWAGKSIGEGRSTHLKLWKTSPDKKSFELRGGDNDHVDQIVLKVEYLK